MNERYKKVFSLPDMLYHEKSPVIIETGAIFVDMLNNSVFAQLRIWNISKKPIKAATVNITPFDTLGNIIGDKFEYQYLDLMVARDSCFGEKVPIFLKDNKTRAIRVEISEVIFSDNEVLSIESDEWESIPGQSILLLDSIQTDYYCEKFNVGTKYQVVNYKDLWLCTCGEINKKEDERCLKCKNYYQELKNIDFDVFKKEAYYEKALKLASRNSIDDIKQSNALLNKIGDFKNSKSLILENNKKIKDLELKAKRTKKLATIITISVIALIIIFSLVGMAIKSYTEKANIYKTAVSYLESKKYDDAVENFNKIIDFKDSKEQIEKSRKLYDDYCEKEYQKACKYFKNGSINEALEIFEKLKEYKGQGENITPYKDSDKKYKEVEFYHYLLDGDVDYDMNIDNATKISGKYFISLVNNKKIYELCTVDNEYPYNTKYSTFEYIFKSDGEYFCNYPGGSYKSSFSLINSNISFSNIATYKIYILKKGIYYLDVYYDDEDCDYIFYDKTTEAGNILSKARLKLKK